MADPISVCDLLDDNESKCQVAAPMLAHYGGTRHFDGPIATVKVFEDNTLVKQYLGEPGDGRVLVVDGGGSKRRALVGDILGQMGIDKGWRGIVVYGCIRDSEVLAGMPIGVMALATIPIKSVKRGEGQRDIDVRFADVTFRPGEHLYAGPDGIMVSASPISLRSTD